MAEYMVPATGSDGLGTNPFFATDLDETPVQAVKTTSGRVFGWHFDNTANSAKSYVQFFNAAVANVTLGTTTPYFAILVPAQGASDAYMTVPVEFGTAISIAATTTVTGSTGPTADLVAVVFYD